MVNAHGLSFGLKNGNDKNGHFANTWWVWEIHDQLQWELFLHFTYGVLDMLEPILSWHVLSLWIGYFALICKNYIITNYAKLVNYMISDQLSTHIYSKSLPNHNRTSLFPRLDLDLSHSLHFHPRTQTFISKILDQFSTKLEDFFCIHLL